MAAFLRQALQDLQHHQSLSRSGPGREPNATQQVVVNSQTPQRALKACSNDERLGTLDTTPQAGLIRTLLDLFKAFRETFSELTSEVGTAVGSAFGQLEAKVNTLRPLEMLEDALTPRTASRSQEKTSPVLRSPPPATTRKSSLSKSRAAASALPLEDWRWDDATENQETSNIMRPNSSNGLDVESAVILRGELDQAREEIRELKAKCLKLEVANKRLAGKPKTKPPPRGRPALQELPGQCTPDAAPATSSPRESDAACQGDLADLQDTCQFLEDRLVSCHKRQQTVQEENDKLRRDFWLVLTMKELLLWKQAQESQGSTDLSVDRDVQSAKHIVPTCPTGLDTSFPPPVS